MEAGRLAKTQERGDRVSSTWSRIGGSGGLGGAGTETVARRDAPGVGSVPKPVRQSASFSPLSQDPNRRSLTVCHCDERQMTWERGGAEAVSRSIDSGN
jgi:hypothetical protein